MEQRLNAEWSYKYEWDKEKWDEERDQLMSERKTLKYKRRVLEIGNTNLEHQLTYTKERYSDLKDRALKAGTENWDPKKKGLVCVGCLRHVVFRQNVLMPTEKPTFLLLKKNQPAPPTDVDVSSPSAKRRVDDQPGAEPSPFKPFRFPQPG